MCLIKTILCVIVPLTFIICINSEFVSSKEVCQKCEPRKFMPRKDQHSDECQCNEYHFCDSTHTCKRCDSCFDSWYTLATEIRGNVSSLIEAIAVRYDADLDKITSLIKVLLKSHESCENEFVKMGELLKKTGTKNTDEFRKKFLKTKQDLEKLNQLIKKNQLNPDDVGPLLDAAKTYHTKINELLIKIVNISAHGNESEIEALKLLLQNLSRDLLIFDNFPEVDNSVFNLALSVESNLQWLDEAIKNYINASTENKFPTNVKDSANQIDEDIMKLVRIIEGIIQNYFYIPNYDEEVNALKKDALRVKTESNSLKEMLKNLLDQEDKFFKTLERINKDFLHYKEIRDLQNELSEFDKQIRNIENETKEFSTFLTSTHDQIENLTKIISNEEGNINRLNEYIQSVKKLRNLLESALIQKDQIEQLDPENRKSVEDFTSDTQDKTNELEKCIEKMLNFTRSCN